ncbi:MAG: class I SAM-dependent methyltransferase [Chloroflexota bacterium]
MSNMRYLESVHQWFNRPQEVSQRLEEQNAGLTAIEQQFMQRLPTQGDILDIGCATGRTSIALAKMGHAVTGIDVAEQLIAQAQTHANKQDLPISYWVCDPTLLPFSTHTFDAVLLLKTYCYVPQSSARIAWLNEIARVLRPRGQLILSQYVIDDIYDSYEPITEENQARFPELADTLEDGDGFTLPSDGEEPGCIHYFLEADLRHELTSSVFDVTAFLREDTLAYYHLTKRGI